MKLIDNTGLSYLIGKIETLIGLKADKTYVDNKVKTDVPENAVFTDTNTTYTEITTAEIDAGTASTRRTITGRRVKYILDKVQIPTGLISMWSGLLTAVPEGWALCNGENGTPDLTDRFIVGAGSSYSVGDTGGEGSVTLSSSQIPSHRHSSGTLSTSSDGDHSHSGSTASAGSHSHTEGTLEVESVSAHTHGSGTYSTSSAGTHTHGYGTYSTSTGGSHSHSSGTLATATAGNHTHTQHYRSIHITGASGDTTRYLVGNTLLTNNTAAAGVHGHVVSGSTASGGSHSHSVSGTSGSGGSHSHSVSGTSESGGSHTHDISGRTSSTGSHSHSVTISSDGSHSHTVSGYTGYIGSGGSHENRPPYYALAYIMKL